MRCLHHQQDAKKKPAHVSLKLGEKKGSCGQYSDHQHQTRRERRTHGRLKLVTRLTADFFYSEMFILVHLLYPKVEIKMKRK